MSTVVNFAVGSELGLSAWAKARVEASKSKRNQVIGKRTVGPQWELAIVGLPARGRQGRKKGRKGEGGGEVHFRAGTIARVSLGALGGDHWLPGLRSPIYFLTTFFHLPCAFRMYSIASRRAPSPPECLVT